MKKKATLLKAVLATIGVGCLAISVSPPYRIWRYDIAFQKIDVGSTAAEDGLYRIRLANEGFRLFPR